ncbi:MAG: ATP-binding protein [Syntrophales bacterium]|nr:ATP-binding protein [Syntrophales bacterium]
MLELALHILDIAENSIRAGARNVAIRIKEEDDTDILSMEITDDGIGMDEKEQVKALDPFYTTKKVRRVGLGLPMLKQAAERAGGTFFLSSAPGKGTTVRVLFQKSHWDRQPLGDVPGAIMAVIAGSPDVDIDYEHTCNGRSFRFRTAELREMIDGLPLNQVEVLSYIKEHIREGLTDIASSG